MEEDVYGIVLVLMVFVLPLTLLVVSVWHGRKLDMQKHLAGKCSCRYVRCDYAVRYRSARGRK